MGDDEPDEQQGSTRPNGRTVEVSRLQIEAKAKRRQNKRNVESVQQHVKSHASGNTFESLGEVDENGDDRVEEGDGKNDTDEPRFSKG